MSLAERGPNSPDVRAARTLSFPAPHCPELDEAEGPELARIGGTVYAVHPVPGPAAEAERACVLRPVGPEGQARPLVCRQLPLSYACTCGDHRAHDPCAHVTAMIRLGHLGAIEESDPADWPDWTDADCWTLTPLAARGTA